MSYFDTSDFKSSSEMTTTNELQEVLQEQGSGTFTKFLQEPQIINDKKCDVHVSQILSKKKVEYLAYLKLCKDLNWELQRYDQPFPRKYYNIDASQQPGWERFVKDCEEKFVISREEKIDEGGVKRINLTIMDWK